MIYRWKLAEGRFTVGVENEKLATIVKEIDLGNSNAKLLESRNLENWYKNEYRSVKVQLK